MHPLRQVSELPAGRRPHRTRNVAVDFGYAGPLFAAVALFLIAVIVYFRFLA
jgi:hypothetical protein